MGRSTIPVLALALGLFAASSLSGHAAHADPPGDPAVERLTQLRGEARKDNRVPAGKSARYGHAEVLVDAPLDKVRAAALDFARYKDLHPRFAAARVVKRDGDLVDLHVTIPVKIGPLTFEQWAVMRFGAPRAPHPTAFVLEASSVAGTMKEGHLVVSARAVDDRRTVLDVDLLLRPSLPAPQALVDEELRDGAMDFGAGLRARAQTEARRVTTR